MERELLFSLTKKHFKVDTFRSGGPGGQHQNNTDSGVRITHIETGISAESRKHRSQPQNKKEAFNLLIKSKLGNYIKERAGIKETIKDRNTNSFGGCYVRTYNLHTNIITNHITGHKIHGKKDIKDFMDGKSKIGSKE